MFGVLFNILSYIRKVCCKFCRFVLVQDMVVALRCIQLQITIQSPRAFSNNDV